MTIDVIKDTDDHRRIERWTDGERIKLGRDIENDRCVDAAFEDLDDLIDELETMSQVTKTSIHNPTHGDSRYIVDKNAFTEYDFYRFRQHVLRVKVGVLYDSLQLMRELRDTFDHEHHVRDVVENHFGQMWEIQNCEHQHSNQVAVGIWTDLQALPRVKIRKFEHRPYVPNEASVSIEDGGYRVSFRVDTEKLRDVEGIGDG